MNGCPVSMCLGVLGLQGQLGYLMREIQTYDCLPWASRRENRGGSWEGLLGPLDLFPSSLLSSNMVA